jgi:acetolactate synthase-1/2/3 large subunit
MTKASDLLIAALENEGVERIFGIPGEENLDVVESLRASKIELVLTRHEQAAGFMAATHGRLTGQPGVCLSTLGPGRSISPPRRPMRIGCDADAAVDDDHPIAERHERRNLLAPVAATAEAAM